MNSVKLQKEKSRKQIYLKSYWRKWNTYELYWGKWKDLYSTNYKTLKKEWKKIPKNGKISCVYGLEELILLNYPYYQSNL